MSAWAGGKTVGGWARRAISKVGVAWDAVSAAIGGVAEACTEAKAKSIPPNIRIMTAIRAGQRGMIVTLYTYGWLVCPTELHQV